MKDKITKSDVLIYKKKMVDAEISLQRGSNQVIYLKGLNGIRAFAALVVVFAHTMQEFDNFKFSILSESCVTIFFTLSGFLITYLLFKEIEDTNTVAVKKFYIRRILRIWPLYFFYLALVVIANVLLFNSTENFSDLWFYVFFMPNVPINILKTGIFMSTHYWSLGVEEQFYLFWPNLIKKIKKNFVFYSIVFIVSFIALKIFTRVFIGSSHLYWFFYYNRFDCMAIGGLAAYLLYKNHSIIHMFNKIVIQIAALVIIFLNFINYYHVSIIAQEIMAVVAVILILNQVSGHRKFINFEKPVLDHLGKISYGIYVYHFLIINIIALVFKKLNISFTGFTYIAFPFLVFALTIVISHYSYRIIELKFLLLKNKYTIVKSSNTSEKVDRKPFLSLS